MLVLAVSCLGVALFVRATLNQLGDISASSEVENKIFIAYTLLAYCNFRLSDSLSFCLYMYMIYIYIYIFDSRVSVNAEICTFPSFSTIKFAPLLSILAICVVPRCGLQVDTRLSELQGSMEELCSSEKCCLHTQVHTAL